jgi:hypothetical protein
MLICAHHSLDTTSQEIATRYCDPSLNNFKEGDNESLRRRWSTKYFISICNKSGIVRE